MVVQPTDENLVASASARASLTARRCLRLVLVLVALAIPLSAPIATSATLTFAPASVSIPLPLLIGLLRGLVRLLGTQKTICWFVAVALPDLYVAAAN